MKNFVVLMMGYTGSGKSTVARKVSKKLGLEVHHSAVVRKELGYTFSKEEAESDFFVMTSKKRYPMDKAVYGEMAKRCRNSLLDGKDVVLDAGYFFKWQREGLYKAVQDLDPEVFIMRVECPEEEIIKRLAKRRDKFSESTFNETPSMKAYESCKIATEDPRDDNFKVLEKDLTLVSGKLQTPKSPGQREGLFYLYKKPIIINYNSHNGKISSNHNGTNKNLNLILSALK